MSLIETKIDNFNTKTIENSLKKIIPQINQVFIISDISNKQEVVIYTKLITNEITWYFRFILNIGTLIKTPELLKEQFEFELSFKSIILNSIRLNDSKLDEVDILNFIKEQISIKIQSEVNIPILILNTNIHNITYGFYPKFNTFIEAIDSIHKEDFYPKYVTDVENN